MQILREQSQLLTIDYLPIHKKLQIEYSKKQQNYMLYFVKSQNFLTFATQFVFIK